MKKVLLVFVLITILASASVIRTKHVNAQDNLPFLLYIPLVNRAPEPYKLDGINFSPYIAGQIPDSQSPISEAQIKQRLSVVAPFTKWIRTFGCGDGLEATGKIYWKDMR